MHPWEHLARTVRGCPVFRGTPHPASRARRSLARLEAETPHHPCSTTLSDKLQRSFKNLRGQGTITDDNVNDALREIRTALLESDVNLVVTQQLVEHIRARAIGAEVATSLSPAEQLVKIVSDELQNILGKDTARFKFSSPAPHRPPHGRLTGIR